MKRKKVLFVIDLIKTGGAEKILLDFRRYLLDKGYEVPVYVLYGDISSFYCGLRKNSAIAFFKLFQQIYLWLKLIFIVKHENPDCVFSILDRSNIITQFLPIGRKYKILTVHNILSVQYDKIKNNMLKWLVFKFIHFSYNIGRRTTIIAVSNQVKDDLIDNFNIDSKRVYVVNNGVDAADIMSKSQEAITEFAVVPDCIYILNIGRFTLQKAQWKLVKAFSILIKSNPKLRLLLIGEGELKAELEKLIEDLSLKDYVLILPFSHNPYKFMKLSTVMVLPSLYEGFPIVLSEASILRLPVIGSNKAIPQEIFDDVKSWKNYVYNNIVFFPDYSSHLYEDDILLAKLMENILSQDNFVKTWNDNIANWHRRNDKSVQYENYVRFINGDL